MAQFDFYFADQHCHKAALEYLKEEFRKYPFKEAYSRNQEKITYFLLASGRTLGRLNYILRCTSEFAGKYDVTE